MICFYFSSWTVWVCTMYDFDKLHPTISSRLHLNIGKNDERELEIVTFHKLIVRMLSILSAHSCLSNRYTRQEKPLSPDAWYIVETTTKTVLAEYKSQFITSLCHAHRVAFYFETLFLIFLPFFCHSSSSNTLMKQWRLHKTFQTLLQNECTDKGLHAITNSKIFQCIRMKWSCFKSCWHTAAALKLSRKHTRTHC